MAKKESKNDKLERFKKTQELMEILKRGNIEDQALLYSTSETLPSEEKHASDLLNNAESISEGQPVSRQAAPKTKSKAATSRKSSVAQKSGRKTRKVSVRTVKKVPSKKGAKAHRK
ncbi:MAG: hypothetical protein ACP5MK_01080 [Candidatus Micrarchaeia archaeon]